VAPQHNADDGGVLHDDLRTAAMQALDIPRSAARRRALQFDWAEVCREFIGHLVPARHIELETVTKASQKLHKLVS